MVGYIGQRIAPTLATAKFKKFHSGRLFVMDDILSPGSTPSSISA